MTMSNEQVGKYIRLLCLQHQKGTLSERDMLAICGQHDDDIFEKFERDDTGYFNVRMREEIEKRAAHAEKQRENIRRRWNKPIDTTVLPDAYHGITTVIPLENENENRIVNTRKSKNLNTGEEVSTRATKSIEEREEMFVQAVRIEAMGKYSDEMVLAFINYWTQRNEGGRKMLYEMQRVFDIPKRLTTWAGRSWQGAKPTNGAVKRQLSPAEFLKLSPEEQKAYYENQ